MKKLWPVCVLVVLATCLTAAAEDQQGWIQLFDGKTMNGWKAGENPSSWKVENGALVCHGPRSHLFYVGPEQPFKNFEFKAEVMTTPGSNSGIYFHTRYQDQGWPKYGYEVQINNSHRDPVRTGSLYGVVKVLTPPAKDNEWFTVDIKVQGKHVVVKVNDKVVVDYTEPSDKPPVTGKFVRRLGKGTFALQAHDPNSKVYFRNIRVRRLPDE